MTNKATIASINKDVSSIRNFVTNQMSTLRYQIGSLLGISQGGKRNIYDIYGYPKSLDGEAGFADMYNYSRRQGIANRVTWGLAKRCWREGFEVYASSDKDAEQILIEEINELSKTPQLFKKLESSDILNRIGRMSALYILIPDQNPREPLSVSSLSSNLSNIRFIAYPYDGIQIVNQVQDRASSRFGLPEYYQLHRGQSQRNDKDTSLNEIKAHWSRVVLFNENGLESDIEGMGALEPIFNSILDIEKATGGAAEAYFRNARQKIAYELDKDFAASFLADADAQKAFNEKAEEFSNDWKDHISASGTTVKPVNTPHSSPLDTVKTALWNISGQTGLPIRVLTGEGAGQLAGSEDQLAYNQIIKDRQNVVCKTWVSRVLDILALAGLIDLPKGYEVRFPPQESTTEKELIELNNKKADTLQKLTSALSSVGGDGVDIDTALSALGLDEIEYDENKIDEIDDGIDDIITEPDENAQD